VVCSDGACGDISRLVVDPVARSVTHIVVEPKHRQGQGRLVPIELVGESGGQICLTCSGAEFDELDYAEETHFISAEGQDLGYGDGEILVWPYYGLGTETGGLSAVPGPRAYFSSRLPTGDVEVRRGECVHATDGDIGRVQGLVVDPEDHRVTHVLLEEGHLWGKKAVAIPIESVKEVSSDGVRLALSKDDVKNLPSVDVDRPH
jgi:hypothetical protein